MRASFQDRPLWGLVLLFVAAYGLLLAKTDGLPYVFDNNESFSAYVHGRNLHDFPLSASLGLTDEAYGPDPAAHPYVYTHQGNFPRIPAYLMYVAGLRTVESQIVCTTFTVGLATILLIYLFFREVASQAFGFLVAMLFLSSYILSAQWIVNTFKVWHGFLLFAILLALQRYFCNGGRRWLAVCVAAAACVAYFDLMLAVFTFSVAALFVLYCLRTAGRSRVIMAALVVIGAAAISVAVFVAQLIGYYGWDGFREDLYLTFVARNHIGTDPAVADRWRQFFLAHKVVFWEVLVDSSLYTHPYIMVRSLFVFGFSVLTPYLSFLALALVLGRLLSTLNRGVQYASVSTSSGRATLRFGVHWCAWFAVCSLFTVVLFTTRLESPTAEINTASIGYRDLPVLGLLAMQGLMITLLAGPDRRLHLQTPLLVIVYCCALVGLLLSHGALYRVPLGDMHAVWAYVLLPWHGSGAPKAFAALTITCGLWWIVFAAKAGFARARDREHSRIARIISILGVAYVLAYYFSPGYMQVINLQRFAPMLVFILLPLLSWSALCVLDSVLVARRMCESRSIAYLPLAAWVLLAVFLGIFWVGLQKAHLEIAPPIGADVFKLLDRPPFKGASFVVNSYGAPVAAKTGSWAYIDPRFFQEPSYFDDGKGMRPVGTDIYKWFADREKLKYRNPEFALCYHMHPGFNYGIHALRALRLRRSIGEGGNRVSEVYSATRLPIDEAVAASEGAFGCSRTALSIAAESGSINGLSASIVARDRSPLDRWTIIKLPAIVPPAP